MRTRVELAAGRVERNLNVEVRTAAPRALDGERPAERFDPVGEPYEPGAPVRVGAPVTVVTDRGGDDALHSFYVDLHHRGVRMFSGVGKSLGNDVIDRDLHRLG